MQWILVLVVTVWKRGTWNSARTGEAVPWKDKTFEVSLEDGQDGASLAQCISQATRAAEQWLNGQGVSLVTHVVVTVYSLEVCDAAA